MKDSNKVKEVMLISSLNMAIDQLPQVIKAYKDVQLNFASTIYESNNAEIFSSEGSLSTYEEKLVEILDLLQAQLDNLISVRKTLDRPN